MKSWKFEVRNHVAYMQMCQPKLKNRFTANALQELGKLADEIKTNTDIWVVVVEGSGGNFSTGADVSLIAGMIGQEEKVYRENLKGSQAFFDAFESIPKPTIAKIEGFCLGAGIIMASCCDFRIAAKDTIFGLPEVQRSIGVIMGTQRISRLIGIPNTKEIVMLGENFSGERAHQMGLVHEIHEANELDAAVQKWLDKLLKLPPLAVGLCKRIIDEGLYLERAGQDLEIDLQQELLESADFNEAINSFFEKRAPKYKGV